MLTPYIYTLLIMTAITSIAYSYDFAVSVGQWKHYNRDRVPEYVLLVLTALGGGLGALVTIKVQRHKASEKNKHFKVVTYSSIAMNAIVFVTLLVAELIGG